MQNRALSSALLFIPGLLFGWVLIRAEVVSWYRIQEMFHFQSFHMYGVIGSAIVTGALSLWVIRRFRLRALSGDPMQPRKAPLRPRANLIGGVIFGLGWAVTGACPGPSFVLIGNLQAGFLLVLLGALGGALAYNALKGRLPE